MVTLNNILQIGETGLMAHKARMAVISHNVANVDTPGYHRQRVKLEMQPPLNPDGTVYKYAFGTGVKIADIVRDYNQMMENTLRDQSSASENHGALAQSLKDLEALLAGADDNNLGTQFQQFWQAWQDVANNADSQAYRNVLLQHTAALTSQFNSLAARLTSYNAELLSGTGATAQGAIARDVSDINGLATRIASLNLQIGTLVARGVSASDLLDSRDILVGDLAKLTNFTMVRETDQTYTITIDGQTLVQGSTANAVSIVSDAPPTLQLTGVNINPTGGSVAGEITAMARIVTLQADLDTLANTLVTQVNALHVNGYDLQGNTGANFFDPLGITAGAIALDPALVNNPGGIAAAATLHGPGVPNVGDGAVALSIADLCQQAIVGLNNRTFGNYYTDLLTNLGSNIQAETNLANDADNVVQMLSSTIQSQSGVNLDEEMANMLAAQRAYAASAKIIAAADEMLDVVINRM